MPNRMHLDTEKTYKAIRQAAKEGRFISYGEIADASGLPWAKARRLVPTMLGQLATIAHERGWPLLSAIVVTKENLKSGAIEDAALDGFLGAARMVGLVVDDPQAFVTDQQHKVFAWASGAPEALGLNDSPVATGPRFLRYCPPVLDALRALGGQAAPEAVFAWIKENMDVPQEELDGVNKGGQSKFENKVAWARFYLAKAGLIDGGKRGVWALTADGAQATLDHKATLGIFRQVRERFKAVGDENEPPPETASVQELFDDRERAFWFVGAIWNDIDDQLNRFLADGIWQNGYDEKLSDHVRRMKPGDRIAIKASFVQKYNLPFENRGRPVSCMRIKAIGTITRNVGDGKTVKVDWKRLEPPRDWFFYTYRITVVEADPNDDLARRLILFTFADALQDHGFWLTKVPYFERKYRAAGISDLEDTLDEQDEIETEEEASAPNYTIDDIIEEGCFLPRAELERALLRIVIKKNLILQGPPGTGKTWLARKLAYALIGSKDRKLTRDRLRVVQFHPSLSYEDFVRGWRPSVGGQLSLIDGIFLETVQAAAAEPDRPFVLIIEEINRGNPAQIFGEMLTVLEDSKRNPDDAIELAYRRSDREKLSIPPNLHVIGTMNIADRSLALVDLALRRRFAFVTLEPQLNSLWKEWCTNRCGMSPDDIELIAARMESLNKDIAGDRSLGPQYRIGHSYVTPLDGAAIADARRWFTGIAQTEIIPLLEEYWFDASDKVEAAAARLLEGLD